MILDYEVLTSIKGPQFIPMNDGFDCLGNQL